jgi:hypothetical protein
MLVFDDSVEATESPPELVAFKDVWGLTIARPNLIPELTAALRQVSILVGDSSVERSAGQISSSPPDF